MTTPADGSTAGEITLVTTTDVAEATLDGVYADVLMPAFPPAELVDHESFRLSYGRTDGAFPGIIALHGAEPVGVALGERHYATGLVLLGYLAVKESHRDRHIGAALLGRANEMWGSDPATTGILAEIEDPRHHDRNNYGDPQARLRFYRRAGSRIVPITYFQPSLAPGSPRVHGMLLLSLLQDQDQLSGAALLEFIDDYLLACEGAAPSPRSDDEYRELRSSVERWGPQVPLRAIDDASPGG